MVRELRNVLAVNPDAVAKGSVVDMVSADRSPARQLVTQLGDRPSGDRGLLLVVGGVLSWWPRSILAVSFVVLVGRP